MIDRNPVSVDTSPVLRPVQLHLSVNTDDLISVNVEYQIAHEKATIKSIQGKLVSLSGAMLEHKDQQAGLFAEYYTELKKKISDHPESAKLQSYLSELAELSGDDDSSIAHLREAFQLSQSEYVGSRLAFGLYKKKDSTSAIELLEGDSIRSSIVGLLVLAAIRLNQGQLNSASESIGKAIECDPLNANARLMAGTVALIQSQFPLAIRNFRQAADILPHSVSVLSNLGLAYRLNGEEKKSRQALEQAHQINPLNQQTVLLLADARLADREPDRSIRLLEQYLDADQSSPELWDRLAYCQYVTGRYREALNSLRAESALNESEAAWNNLALVNWKSGNYKKAEACFSESLRLVTPTADLWPIVRNYVEFLSSRGRLKEVVRVVADFTTSDAVNSNQAVFEKAEALFIYAAALHQLDEYETAVSVSIENLKSQSVAPKTKLNFASLLLFHFSMVKPDNTRAFEVLELVESTLQQLPDLPPKESRRLMNNIVYVLLENDEMAIADRYLNYVKTHLDQDVFLTATFGLWHFKNGRYREGVNYYKKAVKLTRNQDLRRLIEQKMQLETARYHHRKGNGQQARIAAARVLSKKTQLGTFTSQARALISEIDQS